MQNMNEFGGLSLDFFGQQKDQIVELIIFKFEIVNDLMFQIQKGIKMNRSVENHQIKNFNLQSNIKPSHFKQLFPHDQQIKECLMEINDKDRNRIQNHDRQQLRQQKKYHTRSIAKNVLINKSYKILIYRQFCRRKYLKYRHQFSKMKQSEVIDKIVNQWGSLQEKEILKLSQIYKLKGGTGFQGDLYQEERKTQLNQKEKFLDKQQPATITKIIYYPKLKNNGCNAIYASQFHDLQPQSNDLQPQFNDQQPEKAQHDLKYPHNSQESSRSDNCCKKFPKARCKYKNQNYSVFYLLKYEQLRSKYPRWNYFQISSKIKASWAEIKIRQKNFKKSTQQSNVTLIGGLNDEMSKSLILNDDNKRRKNRNKCYICVKCKKKIRMNCRMIHQRQCKRRFSLLIQFRGRQCPFCSLVISKHNMARHQTKCYIGYASANHEDDKSEQQYYKFILQREEQFRKSVIIDY